MSAGLLAAGATPIVTGFLSSLGITMLPVQAGIFPMGDAMFPDSPPHGVTLSRGFQMSETVVPNMAMDAYIQDRGEKTHGTVVYDAHGRGYVASVGPEEWPLEMVFSRTHPYLQGLSDLTAVAMAELVPSPRRYERLDSAEIFARPNHPAVEVSWFHALGFIAWLSHKTSIPFGFGLPTEAQWEHAMRAGRGQRFPYATADGTTLQGVHWSGAGLRQVATAAVDREGAARNPWGFKDGPGQVGEWTASWWSKTYPQRPVTDPLGPPRGQVRVLRGGSFSDDNEGAMRIGQRDYSEPRYHDNNIGFRVVAPLDFV